MKLNGRFLALALALAGVPGVAHGDDLFWIGGTGNWNVLTNWSTTSGGGSAGNFPDAATENAIVDLVNTKAVIAGYGVTIGNLTVSPGAGLDVQGMFNADASLTFVNGSIGGTVQMLSTSNGSSMLSGSGLLTIEGGGLLELLSGPNTLRIIRSSTTNMGTFRVNAGVSAALDRSSATFENAGLFDNAGAVSFGSSSVFTLSSGSLVNNGTFVMSADTFNFNGGTISGNAPVLASSVLNIGAGSTGAAQFVLAGGSTLSGDIAAAQTVRILGRFNESATVSATGPFTNAGVAILTSESNGAATLVGGDLLTNTGTLHLQAGGASSRILTIPLLNQGMVTVDAGVDASLNRSNTLYTNEGVLNNQGAVTFGASGTFAQAGGMLDNAGTFRMSADTFTFTGGNITGNAIELLSSVLTIGPAAGTGNFNLTGNSLFNGDVAASRTLTVRGELNNSATLSVPGAFANNGTLNLTTISNGSATLVGPGTLTNTGQLALLTGAGDVTRMLTIPLVNDGAVLVQPGVNALLNRSNTTYVNNGSFTNAGNVSFGSGGTFVQNAGTLTNLGTFTLSGDTFLFNGGSVVGNTIEMLSSVLTIGPAAGVGDFNLTGSTTFTGNIANRTLTVRGELNNPATLSATGPFTNDATLILTSNSNGSATLAGAGLLTNNDLLTLKDDSPANNVRILTIPLVNNGKVDVQTGVQAQLNRSGTTYTNNASFNNAGSVSFGSSGTFVQAGGTLTNSGSFVMSGDTFTFSGGQITGNPLELLSSTLNLMPGAGTGQFNMTGNSTLNGTQIDAGHVIRVRGELNNSATLSTSSALTNDGVLVLTSISNGSAGIAGAEVLTNNNQLTLQAGGAAQRLLTVPLVNNGVLDIEPGVQASLNRSGTTYLNSGVFNNQGTVDFGSAATFTQLGGTLQNAGSFAMSGDTFHYGGGSITGNPLLLTSSTLHIAPGATGTAKFDLFGSCTITGDTASGQVVRAIGTLNVNTSISAANGFTNGGELVLTSISNGAALLVVASGALANNGTFDMTNNGGNNVRFVTANLDNEGLFIVRTGVVGILNRTNGVYDNHGIMRIDGQLSTEGSGPEFFTNHSDGTLKGIGTLVVDQPGTSFSNAGVIAPGNSAGELTIRGLVPFLDTASLSVELGGLVLGDMYDVLTVQGDVTLDGQLLVSLIDGFVPAPTDTFTILRTTGAGNDISGTFDNTPGGMLVVPGVMSFSVIYSPTAVTLTNFVPIPEPASLALLGIGAAALLRGRRRV